MTELELAKAKEKYNKLLLDNEEILKLKEKFGYFCKDSRIQEYKLLKNWDYFSNRVLELEQLDIIKKYDIICELYGGFEEKSDSELVELAFQDVFDENNQNNVYVYIGSDMVNKDNGKSKGKFHLGAQIHVFKNLETKANKVVEKKDLMKFTRKNKVIVFKNSNRDPIVLFNSYRVMYLRQFLLNNHSNLFSENKLVKKLSIDNSSK